MEDNTDIIEKKAQALKEFANEHNISYGLAKIALDACDWSTQATTDFLHKAFQLATRYSTYRNMTLTLKALAFCNGDEKKAILLVDMIENH